MIESDPIYKYPNGEEYRSISVNITRKQNEKMRQIQKTQNIKTITDTIRHIIDSYDQSNHALINKENQDNDPIVINAKTYKNITRLSQKLNCTNEQVLDRAVLALQFAHFLISEDDKEKVKEDGSKSSSDE